MAKWEQITMGVAIFFLGITAGIFAEDWRNEEEQQKNKEIVPHIVVEKKIPVIHFKKIENGALFLQSQHGEIRIVIGENAPLSIPKNEEKQVDMTEILPLLKQLPAPKNMHFVASKRGKTFYPLDAPEAFLTSPKNRIFFETEEQAKKAGFQRKK